MQAAAIVGAVEGGVGVAQASIEEGSGGGYSGGQIHPVSNTRANCSFYRGHRLIKSEIIGYKKATYIIKKGEVTILSSKMDREGNLTWHAPEGEWVIIRFGYTCTDSRVSTSSGDWQGSVLDYMSRDAVSAKIIAIDKDRLSLSMKQTQEDPWAKEASAFNKGDAVDGTVTRITPFGAFIQLSPSVEALVHISELGEGQGADPEKLFTLNEKKKFKVLDIDRDNRKISLSLQ